MGFDDDDDDDDDMELYSNDHLVLNTANRLPYAYAVYSLHRIQLKFNFLVVEVDVWRFQNERTNDWLDE